MGHGCLIYAGRWICSVDYELIPQSRMELDGFVWSPTALLTEGPTEAILQLAKGEGRAFVRVVLLGYDHRRSRYRYGVRLSERSRRLLETISPDFATGLP